MDNPKQTCADCGYRRELWRFPTDSLSCSECIAAQHKRREGGGRVVILAAVKSNRQEETEWWRNNKRTPHDGD